MDWKDALAGLMPDDYKPEETVVAGAASQPKQTDRLQVFVERKGRGGKVATIITGFTISDDAVAEVASRLKQRLGTGGSARVGEILIQGDRAGDVKNALAALGYKTGK